MRGLEEGEQDGPHNDGKVNRALQEQNAKQREGAEKPFVPLLILSALVVAFARKYIAVVCCFRVGQLVMELTYSFENLH